MKYKVAEDIKIVCTLLDITFSKLAEKLNVSRSTVLRIVKKETYPSDLFLESFYSFAYRNNVRPILLNSLKTQFAFDQYDKVLFHGAKSSIDGDIDLQHSRNDIDVGVGFYLGESYEQAASYIFSNKKASIYVFDARKLDALKIKEFSVSLEWMLMVSYYREYLKEYENSKIIKRIISEINSVDVVIAPIADNDMYETMSQFARGDITDLQAISALSASNLGKQHVLKSELACKNIVVVDRLYLCALEREAIESKRRESAQIAMDKASISIKSFRRQGKYVEELLK